MPPSTFASAAASGTNSNSPRLDSSNEWSRRSNGATQTFRRSSAAVTSSSNPPTNRNSIEGAPVGVYVPPHRNGTATETRYSKQQMLDLFRVQQDADALQTGLSHLFIDGWDPESVGGVPQSPWTRRDEQKEPQPGAEVCWDRNGSVQPLWLRDLSADEKEHFASVNSPIKALAANATKDLPTRETGGRKPSVSGASNTPGGYNVTSPTSRPNPRRRDTNDAYPFPNTSNSGMGRFSRDESHTVANPPASLLRRKTETTKENHVEEASEKPAKVEPASSFAGIKRTGTGGLGSNGAWGGSPNTAFSPMGGAFGKFALPGAASAAADKRPGNFGAARSESRFKGLMKDSGDTSAAGKEQVSLAGLGQTFDAQPPALQENDDEDHDAMTGSAALQGADDESPPRTRITGRFAGIGSRLSQDTNPSHDLHQTPHRPGAAQADLTSPTDTNPYQSPGTETEHGESLPSHQQSLPGLGGFMNDGGHGLSGLMGLGAQRLGGHESIDRSQNSSVSNKPVLTHLTSLPGLGSNAGWPSAQPTAGTPTRERLAGGNFGSAFGDGIFSPVEQPTGLGFPTGFGATAGLTSMGRSSRLTSFMQANQQEQHRPQELAGLGDAPADPYQQSAAGTRGRNAFNAPGPAASSDNQFRSLRAPMDEFMSGHPGHDASASPNLGSDTSAAIGQAGAIGQRGVQNPPRQGSVNSTGSAPHAPQIRQMVMPDRMRWLYKDPSGSAQGPWSGLEMHDWYKAGFFTPELLIRKVEDVDFEPLAQLIRRIGNSREPFLVPQIGVPHEPPASARGWSAASGPTTSGGIQPPFPNSFPSFGTTLTAEQQNALERRKQEEQFLMARQKEQLAQRQYGMNMQMHAPFHSGAAFQPPLSHQPSSQSLHSQPSFGNLGAAGGFAGGAGHNIAGLGDFRSMPGTHLPSLGAHEHQYNMAEPELAGMMGRVNPGRNGQAAAAPDLDNNHSQQVAAMLNERARLEREQAQSESHAQHHEAAFGTTERLHQFQGLHASDEDHEEDSEETDAESGHEQVNFDNAGPRDPSSNERQSITQQVQAAVASKGSQPVAWTRVDPHTMHPVIPPPQSSSPMPAPVAQRKHNPAESLNAGSRSHSQTPTIETSAASVAPWAKEVVEVPKAQSLKEIQEVEAKKAAQREEIAAAARRAALEKEMLAQQSIVPAAPGLPSTSNWAASPTTTPTSASVWAKANSNKAAPANGGKKTLQQIQKEEEARKQRVANSDAATATAGATQSLSSGKRYADLASKSNASPAGAATAWTTVGASGKAKTPVPTAPSRSVSSGVAAPAQIVPLAKPKQTVRSTTLGSARIGQFDANEEFKRWAVKELGSHLNKGIAVESFVDNLLAVGLDRDILIEAVHFQSQTIDSRHFAEEFIRRRKLADKGLVAADSTPPLPSASTGAVTGGWNEVTKRGPQVSQEPAQSLNNFKVVPSKKKGRK